jgi:VanZ family protein
VVRPVQWLFPHVSVATLKTVQIVVRKIGHLSEYAVFALLAARALRTSQREFLRAHWFAVSLGLLVAYALGDEFHQSFYPSRTPSIYDSVIDSLGGLMALLVLVFRNRRRTGYDLPD